VAKQGEHPGNDIPNDAVIIDDQDFCAVLVFQSPPPDMFLAMSLNIPIGYSTPDRIQPFCCCSMPRPILGLGGGVSTKISMCFHGHVSLD
jgi:hypothetical protein